MNRVKFYITCLTIYFHDIYCDVSSWLHNLYTVALCAYVAFLARRRSPHVLYAQLGDHDVTLHVNVFYKNDKIISVASMHRWLSRFYPAPEILTLVYMRNLAVNMSKINLETDFEILTAQEIPSGDMELHVLPGKILGVTKPYLETLLPPRGG